MERERKSPSNLLARECIVEAMIKLIYEKPQSPLTAPERRQTRRSQTLQ